MDKLQELLQISAQSHRHLCPRQVLGVRMSLLAGERLGLDLPQTTKRLLTLVETDGCFSDGVAVGAGCWVGRRTLRVVDYGKVAATYVDTATGQAVRLAPRATARAAALPYAPEARNRWEGQLLGYQRLPDDELFSVQAVRLTTPLDVILSKPGKRAICQVCGEEVINEREIRFNGQVLCRACAEPAYYELAVEEAEVRVCEYAGV
jgi:formylmethanofuran dehydrogenase subunit E